MLSLPRSSEHVCRLCLAESADGADMMPLFPVRGGNPFGHGTVVSKILQCTSVKIEHFEGAPALICEYCLARIDDWQAFREQCVGTDEYLRATCRPAEEDGPYAVGFGGQETEFMEVQAEMLPNEEEEQDEADESYLVGEELPVEDLMMQQQQMDEYYGQNGYEDEEAAGDAEQEPEQEESLVQQMNLKSGIRVPKWSQEFGAKLNSLLLVVGGERPHQCKICRKVFMRRPHCRRHVAQAHPQEVEDVKLPNNWKQTFKRRTNLSKVPIQAILQPVPPPPVMRTEQYDPSMDRPHQCEVCKKCFKRAQHLRRHRTSHLQIEIDRSEIMRGIQEQQKAQQQLEELIHPTGVTPLTKVEDDDVIALSDDDEDMGEEISPEEYNGFSGRHFLDQLNGDPQEYGSYGEQENDDTELVGSEESNQSSSQQFLTKNGTFRKRAAPMEKIPGERPYQCQLCAKTFKRSDHLKSHMKVHSSECEYNCPHCAKGFRYRQNYLIHLKNRTCFERGGGRRARKSLPATTLQLTKPPNKQRVLNKLSASLSQSLSEGKRKREVLGE